MKWNELFFDLITLWVTIDPIGTVPVYLAVTKEMTPAQRRRAAIRATVIATGILTAFLYLGQYLLAWMRIELFSFQIAGGIVLFLFALSMIFSKDSDNGTSTDPDRDVAVFPLAMPSIASPGAMLAVVVLANNNKNSFFEETATCGVLLVVLLVTLAFMLLGERIVSLIGRSGLNILARVMGMILAAAAVQMVISAINKEPGPG